MPDLHQSELALAWLSLAVYRISDALVNGHGPWDVFGMLRSWVGCRRGHDGLYDPPRPGSLAELFLCPLCMSFWVSVILVPCWYIWPENTMFAISPFAVSGASMVLAKATKRA